MLGLLGNVAEVSWLRPNLMNSRFVQEITKLLDYDGIEVYFSFFLLSFQICSVTL